ncbi:hypothetical protein [Thalassotalea maritima]|uniref:hypothetical protein n=1 Tax=Thalassotalea maritima TaxID=3242416 RepID=UPI0035299336
MLFKKLRQEESSRFDRSPYTYSTALFLLMFGLTTCLWHMLELIELVCVHYDYALNTIIALALSVTVLVTLNKDLDALNNQQH